MTVCIPDGFRAMCGRVYRSADEDAAPDCDKCLDAMKAEIDAFDQKVARGEITITPFPPEYAARLLSHLRKMARKVVA